MLEFDVVGMYGKVKHAESNLLLFKLLSLSSNTTERNSFLKISLRIFENSKLFIKKIYEIRMKQLEGELIKKSRNRYYHFAIQVLSERV